ncbi:uncharacterized protein [Leptinotarsa decemlineata]|uniref:uncharacterized protein n=1 Tax=Leptinotarsa decemlineata TaxID=7539 RepID=UPI003D306EF1
MLYFKGKADNARKTGTGGFGKLNDVDNMVLDILGKESPVIVGLGVPASLDEVDDAEPLPKDITTTEQPRILMQDPGVPSTSRIGKQKRSMTRRKEIADKKKVKLDLQIEHLKLQNHKTKLEIYSWKLH